MRLYVNGETRNCGCKTSLHVGNSPSIRPSPWAFWLWGRITKPYSFRIQLPSAKIRNTVETLVSGRQRSVKDRRLQEVSSIVIWLKGLRSDGHSQVHVSRSRENDGRGCMWIMYLKLEWSPSKIVRKLKRYLEGLRGWLPFQFFTDIYGRKDVDVDRVITWGVAYEQALLAGVSTPRESLLAGYLTGGCIPPYLRMTVCEYAMHLNSV